MKRFPRLLQISVNSIKTPKHSKRRLKEKIIRYFGQIIRFGDHVFTGFKESKVSLPIWMQKVSVSVIWKNFLGKRVPKSKHSGCGSILDVGNCKEYGYEL